MKKKCLPFILFMLILLMGLTACGKNKEKEKNQEAYRQIGINCMTEGDYKGAIKAFQKALDQSLAEITDREIDICYYKAEAQYKAGNTKDAISTYKSLINYDKDNSKAYYLRGSLYLADGKKDKASEDYKNAINADNKNYELYINIAKQLKNNGQEDAGKKILNQAKEIKPKKADDYTWLGRVYLQLEDYDNAKKQLETAGKKGSKDVQLYLGQLYQAMGDMDNAQKCYEKYVKENENNPDALESLVELAMNQQDYEKAISYLKMFLKTDKPDHEQEMRRKLIYSYEHSGDFASAKTEMEAYLKKYPNDEDAKRETVFLQTR